VTDYVELNPGERGDKVSVDQLADGVKVQRVKVQYGADGTASDVTSTTPLPVSGQTMQVAFSTTATLNAGQTYTSAVSVFDTEYTSQVQTEVLASHNGTLTFTFYGDTAGTDAIRTLTVPYLASEGYRQFGAPTFGLSAKWAFTNTSGSNQTDFYFSTKLLRGAVSPQVLALDAFVSPAMVATVGRAVLTGATDGGLYRNIQVDNEGHLQVHTARPATAFGDLAVAEKTPIVQVDFVHGISPASTISWAINSAPAPAATNGRSLVSSGTNAAGHSQLISRRAGRYRPGEGLDGEFTAAFLDGGKADSEQIAGLVSAEAGIGWGYNNAAFGILHRTGGKTDVRTLTVSVGAGGAETATVTLDGEAKAVSLVAGSTTATANQLAEADYTTTGRGWYAHAIDATVIFTSVTAGPSGAGAFTLGSTGTAAGTIASTRAGVAPTDNWVAQANFSADVLDGTGSVSNPSGFDIDPTTLNVYKIQEQYLGAGGIDCFVENPVTKTYVLAHRFEFANSRTEVTLSAPTSRMIWSSRNTGATTAQRVAAGSCAAFVEGKVQRLGPRQTMRFQTNAIGTSFAPIMSIWMPYAWDAGGGSLTNWAEAFISSLDVSADGLDPSEFILVRNATLTGANWGYKDQAISPVLIDTSATAYAGGREIRSTSCAREGQSYIDMTDLLILLARGERLTVVARCVNSGGTDVYAALNWVVDV